MTARTNKLKDKASSSTGGSNKSKEKAPRPPSPINEEQEGDGENPETTQVREFYDAECRAHYEEWSLEGKKGRKIMLSKVILPSSIPQLGIEYLIAKFRPSYLHLLLTLDKPSYKDEIIQFYANFEKDKAFPGCTKVNGKIVPCDKFAINRALGCPWVDSTHLRPNPGAPFENYHTQSWPKVTTMQPICPIEMGRKYFKIQTTTAGKAKHYVADNLSVDERIVFDWVCYNVLPNGGHTSEPTIISCMIFYYIMEGLAINPGHTINCYMEKAAGGTKKGFPYGGLITRMLELSDVPIFDRPTAQEYYDSDWFKHKGLVLDDVTNTYKVKEADGASTSKGAKRRKVDEGGQPSWFKKFSKVWSCFKGLHEQSQKEMAELQAEQQAYMEGKGVELALSDDDVEPDFGQVPNSSDEDEVDGTMAISLEDLNALH